MRFCFFLMGGRGLSQMRAHFQKVVYESVQIRVEKGLGSKNLILLNKKEIICMTYPNTNCYFLDLNFRDQYIFILKKKINFLKF